jgi:uncharacterized membrane protein YfcA
MAIFYFLTFIIEIIGTIGGFGSSVLFVPMANYFLEFHAVLGILSLLHIFSNLSKIALFHKGFEWGIFIKIGIPSVIFVIVGAYLSQFIDSSIATVLLGLFMVSFSLFLIIRPNFTFKTTVLNSFFGGGLSGFLAGWLGTGGAIRGLALASFNVNKNTFLATSALIDFMVDGSRFLMYLNQGYITKAIFLQAPILLIISIIGSYIGKVLLNKISQKTFKKIALWMIFWVGLYSLIAFFYPLK